MTTETAAPLVLVVEDDLQMCKFLRASLTSNGYRLIEAHSGNEAVALATSHHPDIVLMDLGLPDESGIALTRRLREWMRAPIIVVSARGMENDKVDALDAGADDYVTKPFGVKELLARIRVALRHAVGAPATAAVFTLDDFVIDLGRRRVTSSGRELKLSPIEYRLLATLAKHAGKVMTHKQLLAEVWGPSHGDQTHYLRVYMAQLRRKVEVDPARPRLLLTEPGVGYRMREPDSLMPS